VPVIIWINGGFGAGKTMLAEELHRRLPDAVVYDPEDVGLMLWRWMRPNGDFQHLPSWRELVVATALSLRSYHADTLIVSPRRAGTPGRPPSRAASAEPWGLQLSVHGIYPDPGIVPRLRCRSATVTQAISQLVAAPSPRLKTTIVRPTARHSRRFAQLTCVSLCPVISV
jgi:hypothetical protein